MQEYNICYSLDSAYVEQLAVSIASILKNADVNENINFYILDGGLTKKDKKGIESLKNIKNFNIEYLPVNRSEFSDYPLLKKDNIEYKDYHVTLPTYFRFKLPSLLNSLNKVLYLDCDVIVNNSLKGIFDTNIDNYAVAMVLDADSTKESKRLGLKKYFNAGVMLLNLDFWRRNNLELSLLDYAKKNESKILWQDQDIVNSVLFENIKELPNIWNNQYLQYERVDANKLAKTIIFHLAGRFKPWLIPFEHFIYDLYYYYLLFTPFKNKTIEYKQKASGKFLKDNIGGSATNIRLLANNEDIQKIYSEISAAYEFVKGEIHLLNNDVDDKISKVYEEISKNYGYTKECDGKLQEQIETEVDKKVDKVYEEISKNYDYTKECDGKIQKHLENEFDEKIDKVYKEISQNYDYTKECDGKIQKHLENEFDEKIDKVYKEISQNYDYTNKSIENSKKEFSDNLAKIKNESDANFNKFNSIIQKQNSTINLNEEDIRQLEEKINIFEIAVSDKINSSETNIRNDIKDIEKNIYEEISKNSNYTEYLVQTAEEKQNQKRTDALNEISSSIDILKTEIDSKLNSEINSLKASTEEKNKILEEIFYSETKTLNEKLTKETNHKVSEIYSYTNKNLSKIYKEINDSHYKLENILNDRVYDLISHDDTLKTEINYLKEEMKSRIKIEALASVLTDMENKLSEQSVEYQQNVSKLQAGFDEKINQQRIKYENKLIKMENQIAQMRIEINEQKKNLFQKLIQKIRKTKKR